MLIFERLVFISIFCLYIDKSDYYVTGIVAFAIYYLWGRDLSGTLYGAGGVGGLLAMKKNNVWYFPFYDNNGNVTAYVDMNGNSVATYEYDAFGQMISQSGAMANQFSHRFSTKYFDSETSLYYYGYRFYSPNLCRWLNRDPIEENGGNNLYVGCRNDFINAFDLLGMKNYYSGTEDPLHISDEGAGAWNSESKDLASLMQFAAIRLAINTAFAKYGLPDASAHLDYYFSRRGGVYTIRLRKMLDDSEEARDVYLNELNMAKQYAESLPNGTHHFTSRDLSSGYINENLNWFYAVGGFVAWGKGIVDVCDNRYKMKFEFIFSDYYNWDNGKAVLIMGAKVTDNFMGKFHCKGLGKEFKMEGSISDEIIWNKK